MRAGAVRILILKIIRAAKSFFLLLFFYLSQNASATRRPKTSSVHLTRTLCRSVLRARERERDPSESFAADAVDDLNDLVGR